MKRWLLGLLIRVMPFRKIYHVVLDRALKVSDLQQIEKGVDLDDGSISVDAISYIANATKREVGLSKFIRGVIELFVRIFEHLRL